MRPFLKFSFLFSSFFALSNLQSAEKNEVSQIKTINCVLAHVAEKTISTFDLKQRLDMLFYANFPEYTNNPMARMQFYDAQWKAVLDDMINTHLILLDAEEKQITTADGEVHQEMHERYGPSIAKNLDKAGIRYESAFRAIKDELTVRKMTGHMVHAKAFQQLTPAKIEKAYQRIVKENPKVTIIRYQMITVSGDKPLDKAYTMLQDGLTADQVIVALKNDQIDAKLSDIFEIEETKLAANHKAILSDLPIKSVSKPIEQLTRSGEKLNRIFILHDKKEKLPPSFKEVEKDLTNEILNEQVQIGSKEYIERLRKKHPIILSIPENFHPFEM